MQVANEFPTEVADWTNNSTLNNNQRMYQYFSPSYLISDHIYFRKYFLLLDDSLKGYTTPNIYLMIFLLYLLSWMI